MNIKRYRRKFVIYKENYNGLVGILKQEMWKKKKEKKKSLPK